MSPKQADRARPGPQQTVVFLYEVLGDNEKALASALGLTLAFSPNRRTHVNGAVGTAKFVTHSNSPR